MAIENAEGAVQQVNTTNNLRPARSADQGYASDHPSNPHSKENSDSSNQTQPKSNDHGYDSDRSEEKLNWQAEALLQREHTGYSSPYGSQHSKSSGKEKAPKKRRKRSKSKEGGNHRGSCAGKVEYRFPHLLFLFEKRCLCFPINAKC